MKIIKTYSILLLLCFIACNNEKNMGMTEMLEEESPYENCCGIAPVTFSLGKGKVYVPNAFTANGDGISDIFLPSYNDNISKIKEFLITNVDGEKLYGLSNFDITKPIENAWWGQITDGSYHKGLFKYSMTIFDDLGDSLIIQGEGCSILCDSAAMVLKNKASCLYIIQGNGEGDVDRTLPNYEEYCFDE